jgi:hypothetical protein
MPRGRNHYSARWLARSGGWRCIDLHEWGFRRICWCFWRYMRRNHNLRRYPTEIASSAARDLGHNCYHLLLLQLGRGIGRFLSRILACPYRRHTCTGLVSAKSYHHTLCASGTPVTCRICFCKVLPKLRSQHTFRCQILSPLWKRNRLTSLYTFF